MIDSPSTAPIVCMFECLSDNYGYLIHHPASKQTICIDSPDADLILAKAKSLNWKITQIWNTHWHPDHAGGNAKIQSETGCDIWGPQEVKSRLTAPLDTVLSGGETLKLGELDVFVLATPGHTLQHISYYIPAISSAFVGDTLFALGCGRMFEGNPTMFWDSLQKLRALPDNTKIYCAHEYTLSNLKFAESVEPNNEDLKAYARTARALRQQDKPTIPTLMSAEKACNPFLRSDDSLLQTQLGTKSDSVETFALLRKMKDDF
ncbi:hydroxyacylglutathione hydrolase [Hirschia litorea]|uniref:Hydroxyacylglutathione hydrolase n=1 Tax=Hirschia litorea TaxID=1199156 RepID=A0ABW2IL40_9PROT